jgi:hypothetical protein
MHTNEYFVGMADFSDVIEVAKGKLIHYFKCSIGNNELSFGFDYIFKRLNDEVGIILYNYIRDRETLKRAVDELGLFFSNSTITIMQPSAVNTNCDHYLEVFVFKYY